MARQATNSRPTGARRSLSPSEWAGPPNTAHSCRASSKTITSTARSSGSTARCAFRQNNRGGRRSVLAGRQLGRDRAEVLGLKGLVLRGQRVVDGGQYGPLEVH